jgi:transcription initiation factor IIE alpha subunit
MKKNKAQKIREQISKLHEDLFILQSKCKHKNPSKKHWSTASDYIDTQYYTDFSCPDCFKFWRKDGSK